MSWTNTSKGSATFANLGKSLAYGLATEDLLAFLTTEDDKILAVEPIPGGAIWGTATKS